MGRGSRALRAASLWARAPISALARRAVASFARARAAVAAAVHQARTAVSSAYAVLYGKKTEENECSQSAFSRWFSITAHGTLQLRQGSLGAAAAFSGAAISAFLRALALGCGCRNGILFGWHESHDTKQHLKLLPHACLYSPSLT